MMGLREFLHPPRMVSPTVVGRAPRYKIDFHVARFARAIEQCENPRKLPELEANHRYWLALQEAERELEGTPS